MSVSELKITTNNRPRDVLCWWDLKPREQKEFGYLDTDEKRDSAQFIRYRGSVYDLGEFMRSDRVDPLTEWDGYRPDSYFSGIVVRYCDSYESVIVGVYLS